MSYLIHSCSEFFWTTTNCPAVVSFHWDAPKSEFLLQRHHMTGRVMSHSNMPRGCVVLATSRPRHMLVPKLKSRCWETHFHSMFAVGLPHSLSTSSEPRTEMQLFSCRLCSMNRPFSTGEGGVEERDQKESAQATIVGESLNKVESLFCKKQKPSHPQ